MFPSNRYQKVLLNGQSSTWLPIITGVLQRSIPGPLFFLIYVNDLSKNLSSITKLFADDTALQITAGQQPITANLWPLTAHIYHVMTIVIGGFPKKSFYYYYFYFV